MVNGLNRNKATQRINQLAKEGIPFLSVIDFEMENIQVYRLDEVPDNIQFNINGKTNSISSSIVPNNLHIEKSPISFDRYKEGFDLVMSEIKYGNSFLLNLSYPTEIQTALSFREIFDHSRAKYKLLIADEFVVFSPEPFIKIEDRVISSYPMKGTIDASVEDAERKLRNSKKELAEHYTIVDLIRNDLSQIAKRVEVEKFRYIDKIESEDGTLLQMSSKITGILPDDYLENFGELFFKLLPAGSITGAPKKKTVEIIQEAEKLKRGYYTGVVALFDGKDLDAGVMIRCIEKRDNKMWYRSGGGITHMSNLEEEYQELLDKVYVPIVRNTKSSEWSSSASRLSQSTL